ncbi:MAG: S-layer homology domain-containing protein [Firmicutes bacterium]|nr:S-layer homology domain-containing protein [Bacillota bacterium]
MKKLEKRLSLVLALIMVICQLPLLGQPVSAGGDIIDVSTAAQLKSALEMNGDCTILLLDNIDERHGRIYEDDMGYNHYEAPDGDRAHKYDIDHWCEVGSGRKTLDLNGCVFRIEYKNTQDLDADLLYIPSGADLTVKDSHGTGYVTFDGYIGGGWYMPQKSTLETVRNIFRVDGGKLTVTGGCFEAGRSKEEWVTAALRNGEETMYPYTGNARKSVNGCALVLDEGKVEIYGASMTGRGYTFLDTDGLRYSKPAACIDAKGGELTIIEGYFAGRGGADCVRTSSSCKADIRGGKYQVFTNEVLMLPVPSRDELMAAYDEASEANIAFLSHYNVTDGIYGRLFSPGALDYDNISITYNFKREYMTDRRLSKSLGSYGTIKDFFEEWDRRVTGNTHIGYEPYVVIKPDLDPGEIIIEGHENEPEPWINPDKEGLFVSCEYEPAFAMASKLNGSPLTVTYTYSLYDANQATAKLIGSYTVGNTEPIDLYAFPDAEKALKNDGRYAIRLSVTEDYWTPAYSYLVSTDASYYAKQTFRVTHIDPPGVVSQTRGLQLASKKGGTVKLSVTGTDGVLASAWLRVGKNGSVSRAGNGTFSGATATYSPKVEKSDMFQCVMRSDGGDVYSEPVEVCFEPTFFTPSSARVGEGGTALLMAECDYDDGSCAHIESDGWYKVPEGWKGGSKGLTSVGSSARAEKGRLTIKNVSASDYGEYVRWIETEHGDYFSEKVSLTRGSAAATSTNIKYAEIDGLRYQAFLHTGLYARMPVPPIDWLYSDNPYIRFDKLEWSGVSNDRLPSETSYELTISAKGDYYFELNDRGGLRWSMDGVFYEQAGLGEPGEVLKTVTLRSPILYLPEAVDRIDYTGVMQGTAGESCMWEHMCLVDCQVHEDTCTVTGMSVDPADLPEGLSFQWLGNEGFKVYGVPEIPGIYTAAASVKLSSGYTVPMEPSFIIEMPKLAETGPISLKIDLPELPVCEHDFGDPVSSGAKTHTLECAECGYVITEEHTWDEGRVIKEATPEENGVVIYTCSECGETKEEALVWDAESSGAMTGDQAENAAEFSQDPAKPSEGQVPGQTVPGQPGQPQVPGQPAAGEKPMPFADVPESAYYRDAVLWAFYSEPQVTDGTSPTTFSPANSCTRAQVVTFLWRALGKPAPKSRENPFSDVSESDWFFEPVLWAVEQGITDGTSPTTFSPKSPCKNSHILTFIWRAVGRPGDTGAEKTSQWYADALSWAEDSGLLEGTYSGTIYDVNALCPRANVVEYLYRYSEKQ